MAAKLVTTIKRFTGTAAEKAALVLTDVQAGSTFLQTDAAAGEPKGIYTLDSSGAWVLKEDAVSLTGSSVEEVQTQADATDNVLTFTENISAIEIYHDEATAQEFTVNGLTLTIASGGWRSPIGGTAAKTVAIPAGVTCIVTRLV